MFTMEVTDYLGNIHSLSYVSEPSDEQKAEIIFSYSLEAKKAKDKEVFKAKVVYSKYMVDEIVFLLSQKNAELNKDSAFVTSMFQTLIPIKEMLNAGSYALAKQTILQVMPAYGADYSAIFQDIVDDIDKFNLEHGL